MSTGFTSWEVGRTSSIGSAISQLSWLVAVWETWQGLAYWCDQVSKISNDLFFWLELTCSISAFSSGYFSATNKPFQSSLVPLFQNQSKCETFHMKMSSACSFIFMQIKVIFIRMVSHLDSLWNRGTRELGNGLLGSKVAGQLVNFCSFWFCLWQV